MEPHADLFLLFFSGRAMADWSSTEITSVGGFALQRKLRAGGSYPAYTPCDSNRGWHGEWFYIRNPMGVLHLASFITVYEAFLGMEPHTDLFWLFFSGRAMTAGNSAETAPVGGFTP